MRSPLGPAPYGGEVKRNIKMFMAFALGWVAILVAAAVVYYSGDHETAGLIGQMGSFFYCFTVLIVCMLLDPARKFPGDSPMTRLGKILSFKRR